MATPAEALATALDHWNADNLDGYLELYDEDIRLHGYAPAALTKSEVRAFYEGIFAAFDAPKLTFDEVHWDGDACTIRFTMRGTHVGDFMGVPATGTDVTLPGITILHFAGNRVRERFSSADMLGLLVQVGAIPAPA